MADPKDKPPAKKKAAKKKGGSGKPDLATLLGLIVAVSGIVTGFVIEGGNVKELLQPTAALIVFGGTVGAVLVTTPLGVLKRAPERSCRYLPKRT